MVFFTQLQSSIYLLSNDEETKYVLHAMRGLQSLKVKLIVWQGVFYDAYEKVASGCCPIT